MKHLILLALAGMYALQSFGQTKSEYYDHEWKKCTPKKAFFSAELVQTDSGVVAKDYYVANGQLQMSGKYADFNRNIKNGHFTYYYTDGSIAREGAFEADQRIGVWKTYYPNGQLKSLLYFLNNRVAGTGKYWYSNGQLADSIYTNKDTLMMISWFSNGKVLAAGAIHQNTKMPVYNWVYFRKDGTKSAEIVFDKNSKVVGNAYYDEKGTLQPEYRRSKRVSSDKVSWDRYVQKNIKAPEHVDIPKGKRKIVVLAFNIDETGAVINSFIKAPLHPEYDKAALAVFDNSPKELVSRSFNRGQRRGEVIRVVDFDKIKKKKRKS